MFSEFEGVLNGMRRKGNPYEGGSFSVVMHCDANDWARLIVRIPLVNTMHLVMIKQQVIYILVKT